MKTIHEKAFQLAPVGIMLLDSEQRVIDWNQWLVDKTGIKTEEAIGYKLVELFPGFDNPRFEWALEQAIKNRSQQVMSHALNRYLIPIKLNYTAENDLDLMPQQIFLAPVETDTQTIAMVSIIDVTENVIRASTLMEMACKLEEDSTRDQLTNAYNRRFLLEWLGQQQKSGITTPRELVCLMLDIDHFKNINDEFGHDVGDIVLQQVVGVIDRELRSTDILVRYGGEEFVIILSRVDIEQGMQTAERLRAMIEAETMSPLAKGAVTCSLGVTSWLATPDSPIKQFLKEADEALYQAKESGRNQVKLFSRNQS